MALNITRRDIDEAHRYARDAMSRVRGGRGATGRVVGQLTQTAEVALGAVGVGVLSGRYGPLNVQGVPVPIDLALGVAGHILGFTGLAGGLSNHIHNVSDGVLAAYLTKFGVGYGKALAEKAGVPPRMVVGGTGPMRSSSSLPKLGFGQVFTGAEPLTEAELATMAQAVR